VFEQIKKCGYTEGEDAIPLFPTISDAVHFAQNSIPQLKVQQLFAFLFLPENNQDFPLQPARPSEPTQFGAAAG